MIRRFALAALLLSVPLVARAEAERDRFGAGGYFRVMTRPDAQGGDGKLGYSDLYGRLMNEGPYAALELKLDLLQQHPRSYEPWTSLHAKVEGGSIANADPRGGSLDQFRLSQLYVEAGNVGLRDVTWRLGTLDYYFGDLGLYDMKPAEIFFDTVGISGMWHSKNVDVLLGAGDAGYFVRGSNYDTVFSGGGMIRARLGGHLEIGGGGQALYEPSVVGNRFAPYATPGVGYADYAQGVVVKKWYDANPTVDFDTSHKPGATSSEAWKVVGYLGFGRVGRFQWNNLFFNVQRLLPENFATETCAANADPFFNCTPPPGSASTYTLFVHDVTDQRMQINIGDEAHFSVLPELLDAAVAAIYGNDTDADNKVTPTDFARTYYSAVGRLQLYLSPTVHLLGETSLAREISRNGNVYRDHADSIFANSNGAPDPHGLQFGDDKTRDTWQGKVGVVLNPTGYGLFSRPSLRILYGLQFSSQNNAFGNSFVTNLSDYNYFGAKEQHVHQMVGLEAEAWF